MKILDSIFINSYYKSLKYFNHGQFESSWYHAVRAYLTVVGVAAFLFAVAVLWISIMGNYFFQENLPLPFVVQLGERVTNLWQAVIFLSPVYLSLWVYFLAGKRFDKIIRKSADRIDLARRQARILYIFLTCAFLLGAGLYRYSFYN